MLRGLLEAMTVCLDYSVRDQMLTIKLNDETDCSNLISSSADREAKAISAHTFLLWNAK